MAYAPFAMKKSKQIAASGREDWSEADWRTFFDERAGIAEFDQNLPREEAMPGPRHEVLTTKGFRI